MQSHITVYETCSTIRYLGRQALRDHWVMASVAVLIYMACIQIPPLFINAIFGATGNMAYYLQSQMGSEFAELAARSMHAAGFTSIFSSIYTLLVSGAFTFGISYFFISLVRKQPSDYSQVFSGFSYFGRSLGLFVLISLIEIAFMIPSIFFFVLGVLFGSIALMLLGFLAIFLVIIPALMFGMSFFLLADNPEIGVTRALGVSKDLMRGNMGKYFLLNLSFIGWIIVAGIITGIITTIFSIGNTYVLIALGGFIGQIGIFVVTAYMYATQVQFYDLLTGRLRLSNPVERLGGLGYGE